MIEGGILLGSLKEFRYGHSLNQPIDGIVWPVSLNERFRRDFQTHVHLP